MPGNNAESLQNASRKLSVKRKLKLYGILVHYTSREVYIGYIIITKSLAILASIKNCNELTTCWKQDNV